MEKTYQPAKVEQRIYQMWEKGGYFTPKIDKKKRPFVITLPPPNVTGGLHAGHALYVIEDIMARYYRLKGVPTLWLPGFDHASIAVEYLVTKQLRKESKTKKQIGRQEFLKRATRFANNSRKYIRQQMKRLGFSVDWTREAYTMDKLRSQAVKEAFTHLYQKGLIYQGERIINWCPTCQTAISDLENEHQEKKGKLYFIKYGPLTIATTRPETMFADVAVAVHPANQKYQKLIGQKVPLPLTNRQIPVIKDEAVDPKFGTGALKITPAHDQLDFEIGERHKLEKLISLDSTGKLTKVAGKYAGLSVLAARKKVTADLKKGGFIEKIEDYTHAVGHCERCGTVTEPMISKQWFVKTKPLANKAMKAVKSGRVKIFPKRFAKVYFHWLENIQDWCISRQLWWGHKIPLPGVNDTLDTWFSSGLWPISVFGWPQKTKDFQYFYTNRGLGIRETGYDILFFWVAREIMMCLEMTRKVPFNVVYLHGIVRDEKGRKFSKSKGIGFDPLEIMEKYGTDALRMALIVGNAPGNDLKIGEEKVIAYRNFANKLWNIGRFIMGKMESKGYKKYEDLPSWSKSLKGLNAEDKKIVRDLHSLIKKTTSLLERYRFDLAAERLYHFVWHRFADEYIEHSKDRVDQGNKTPLVILRYIYFNCLKLLHPFMPFVTEEIWCRLNEISVEHPRSDSKSGSGGKFPRKYDNPLIISKWPETN